MRTAKILGIVIGALVGLVILVLLGVWLFVNPNHYKPDIEAAVKKQTGRDLILSGDIKLSVFPWIALELGPASLGNPPGFGAEPFISFKHASVRVRLLPLLSKHLEVGRIELDGLDVRMVKNAAGKGNWEGFGKASGGAQPAAPADEAGEHKRSQPGLPDIGGIKVTNSRLSYQAYVLSNLNFETASLTSRVVPISLSFDADRGVPNEHATVQIKMDFSNPSGQQFRLEALNGVGEVQRPGDDRPLRWNIVAPGITLDLDAQTLAMPSMEMKFAGAQVNLAVQGTKIVDAPSIDGSFTLAPLVLREFAPRLGIKLPATTDPRALSSVSGSTKFAYGGNALRLENLIFTLDDTHLTGGFAIDNLDTEAMKFALNVDKLDANRYLPPAGTPPAPASAKPAPKPGEKPSPPLDAHGTLAIGALTVSKLALTHVDVTLAAQGGLMTIHPLTAQVDGGNYSGDITLDSRTAVPAISMDEHLTGVDMTQLTDSQGKKIHMAGKGNVDIKAAGHGATSDAILRSLDGHFAANVAQGAIVGVDLPFQIARAEALLKQQAGPTAADTNRTPFETFKMTAEIVNGVATSKDLTIASPVIKVTGNGSANLATQALDFSLLVDTLHSLQGVPVAIPLKITGTTSDPVYRPDLEALAKGQLKDKVQSVIQDKLKGLFGH